MPGEKLFFVQLADAPKLAMDVLSWSRHFRNFPGQGDLDVTGFMRAVLASGYAGPLSLEVFNDDFRAAPARLVARDGLRSLILDEAEAADGAACPPPRCSTASSSWNSPSTRPPAQELADISACRSAFDHAGRHKSKAVDLYRQGGVNLVLNAEQDSAAAEHFQLHGAVGLRDGAPRGRRRAHAGARARAALSGVAGADRRRASAAYPRGARARRHADLSGAARNRPAAASGRTISTLLPAAASRAADGPARSRRSTMWCWRCRPGGWRPSCCSGARLFGLVPQNAARYAGPVRPGAQPRAGQSRRARCAWC